MNALDLYCGAGGAARGLMQAGFHVTGVDLYPQPNYPFRFIQADALALSLDFIQTFDFVHASPPCQALSTMRHVHNAKPHLNLIPATSALLKAAGKPFVIENVEGARAHLHAPTKLCGSMFGLQAPDGLRLQRHRLFEVAGFSLTPPTVCRHRGPTIGIYGAHLRDRRRPAGTDHKSGSNRPWAHGFIAMGVPVGVMTLAELSEAIPPAYSRYVAEAFLKPVTKSFAPWSARLRERDS